MSIEDKDKYGDRDLYAEGADAALAGDDDIPDDVAELGAEAEALWIDGYESVTFDNSEEGE